MSEESFVLHLIVTDNIGSCVIDNKFQCKSISIKSVAIKFKEPFDFTTGKRYYLRMNSITGSLVSNDYIGFPLFYNEESCSIWTPDLKIRATGNIINKRIDYVIYDEQSVRADMTNIHSLEILLEFEV